MTRAEQSVPPFARPPDGVVQVPGSKSITNRALVCAALATGTTVLEGALVADDTEAMVECLERLGVSVRFDRGANRIEADGCGGRLRPGPIDLDARQSGTTARFLLPLLALGPGPYRLDGDASLRRRPMGELAGAVRSLGSVVRAADAEGDDAEHLPLIVQRPTRATAPPGRRVEVRGDITSQFLTGLMLAGPGLERGVMIDVHGPVVSLPYISMTAAVMAAFGAAANLDGPNDDGLGIDIAPGGYRAATFAVEPDASAASYFFAAAAITGGRVRVEGLGRDSVQGDLHFVDVLEQMGAAVERGQDHTEVRGTGALHGVDVDLVDMPDMATTLAAVAVFADSPTEVRGVQIIRGHETDRIAGTVFELRRTGIEADERADGFTVHPGSPRPAVIETYDDHRMAMSFALLGLRAPGIAIADPGCVAKTFPRYFQVLDSLRRPLD